MYLFDLSMTLLLGVVCLWFMGTLTFVVYMLHGIRKPKEKTNNNKKRRYSV